MIKINHVRMLCMLVFAVLLFLGCQNERIGGKLKELYVDCSQAKLFLSDGKYVESISYIPLETTEGNYLNEVDGLRIFGEYFFFIERDGLNNKVISIFDKRGTFIRQISSPEEGPGYFMSVYDLWYDEEKDVIELLDSGSGKIVKYSLAGEHIGDLYLPGQFQEFVKFSENKYALYSGFSPQNSGMYNFCHLRGGALQSCSLEFPEFFIGHKMEGPHFAPPALDHDNFLLHDSFNDTIYCFNRDENSLYPAYRLDLGNTWIDEKWISDFANGDMREKMMLMNRSGYVNSFLYAHEENGILTVAFRNSTERRRYFYFFDRIKNRSYLFYAQSPQTLDFISNGFDQGPITSNFLARQGNDLYFLIESADFKYHFDRGEQKSSSNTVSDVQLSRYQQVQEEISNKLNNGDNPVIMQVSINFSKL